MPDHCPTCTWRDEHTGLLLRAAPCLSWATAAKAWLRRHVSPMGEVAKDAPPCPSHRARRTRTSQKDEQLSLFTRRSP